MPISQERAAELISKYVNDTLTAAEKNELNGWVQELPVTRTLLLNNLTDKKWIAGQLLKLEGTDEEAGWQKLTKKYPLDSKVVPMRVNGWKYVAAAAILTAVIITGAYVWYNKLKPAETLAQDNSQPARFKNDIQPANNGATLTLGDGKVIALDDAQNGVISQQAGTSVNKKDQQLVYEGQTVTGTVPVSFNIVSTAKGKTYKVQLSDGSAVWLNAASSLKFPTAFTGTDRTVELIGEAYFEVAKNKTKPFHVKANGTVVEVLGTHFNINAYADEPLVKTTLLEGSVKVKFGTFPSKLEGNQSATLKPGQQSQATSNGTIKVVDNEDLEKVMAWKNGSFAFKEADIETIMREVARWYDADIVYEGKVTDHFVADVQRGVPVSKLLQLLELTNKVHFKIDGKKITVIP
jgi:mannose-6-phosphate isomerase-like protein (cupin superfamily)